jgi:hypothetical protein
VNGFAASFCGVPKGENSSRVRCYFSERLTSLASSPRLHRDFFETSSRLLRELSSGSLPCRQLRMEAGRQRTARGGVATSMRQRSSTVHDATPQFGNGQRRLGLSMVHGPSGAASVGERSRATRFRAQGRHLSWVGTRPPTVREPFARCIPDRPRKRSARGSVSSGSCARAGKLRGGRSPRIHTRSASHGSRTIAPANQEMVRTRRPASRHRDQRSCGLIRCESLI